MIRGKDDKFFCDDKAAKFLHSKSIKLIEVDGGHNWCEEIEKKMDELTADPSGIRIESEMKK